MEQAQQRLQEEGDACPEEIDNVLGIKEERKAERLKQLMEVTEKRIKLEERRAMIKERKAALEEKATLEEMRMKIAANAEDTKSATKLAKLGGMRRGGGEMEETAAAKNRSGSVGEGAVVELEVEVEEGPRFRRVCVFCGSSSGKRSCYRDAAVELGKELVARGMDLVYGGGSLGLMGEVSEAVHKAGGHVIGVIPTILMGKEITGETVGEVVAVSGMHERKAAMARNADAFIALPGGYGTLDELLEVGLLNVDGYYDFLLAFIDKAVDDGFIRPSQRHIFVSAPDARDLVHKLEEYVAVEEDDPAAPKLRLA
ncbi:hypothetical protein TRIUR3_32468 [Triticum urartu]|uniref:cytokinin riboside 5'-monophosphate phosphoribohydrolase n=1 Tax=Triticum urartu TaxID=4572 RepID=M7Y6H8_TRIUA|nr:hypothetical protein TRIUR3_32468 [Triticum urartu]